MQLTIHGRKITSPFGLIGTDENALTFSLGYTFQQYPRILKWFLNEIGIQVPAEQLKNARIELQRRSSRETDNGVTDIEILLPGRFHVIIEAKIGLGIPTIEQCRKYLSRFSEADAPQRRIVALVAVSSDLPLSQYEQSEPALETVLVGFRWSQLLLECTRILNSGTAASGGKEWVRHFQQFLDHEYRMKAFTTELWILPVDTKPLWNNGLSYWDIHDEFGLYFDRKEPNVIPLYVAFRVNGEVEAIRKVKRIEHGVKVIDFVPDLFNVNDDRPQQPTTVWHFGPAIPLPRTLNSGSGMYARRVRCDLDLLLTCSTVKEIEDETRVRRNETNQ